MIHGSFQTAWKVAIPDQLCQMHSSGWIGASTFIAMIFLVWHVADGELFTPATATPFCMLLSFVASENTSLTRRRKLLKLLKLLNYFWRKKKSKNPVIFEVSKMP